MAFTIRALALLAVWAGVATARPVIQHDPVKVAVRGQPVTVLARVTDESGEIRSVTLFYSVSKDVAPFRVVMKPGGAGVYHGTIPAENFEKASTLFYYIEATDFSDVARETPWYTIPVRSPSQVARGQVSAPPAPTAPAPVPGDEEEPAIRWGTVGLIAGGAAAVVGGAFLIGNKAGGGGGGSSGTVQPGDYDGVVTECFTPDGGSPNCSTRPMTIRIEADGTVSSSTLREGATLSDILRGVRFTLTAPLNDPTNGVGQVVYSGTVANDTIVGTISGEAMTPLGTGTFGGTFSANKRP